MYIETGIELETTRLRFQFQLVHPTITKYSRCQTIYGFLGIYCMGHFLKLFTCFHSVNSHSGSHFRQGNQSTERSGHTPRSHSMWRLYGDSIRQPASSRTWSRAIKHHQLQRPQLPSEGSLQDPLIHIKLPTGETAHLVKALLPSQSQVQCGRREAIPPRCPMASICTPWHPCVHMQ